MCFDVSSMVGSIETLFNFHHVDLMCQKKHSFADMVGGSNLALHATFTLYEDVRFKTLRYNGQKVAVCRFLGIEMVSPFVSL